MKILWYNFEKGMPTKKTNEITNQTTTEIRKYLREDKCFTFRQNTTGISTSDGARSASKKGVSDILGCYTFKGFGIFCAIEIKTGKDRIRIEQDGFLQNINYFGGVAFIAHDLEDFKIKWTAAKEKLNKIFNAKS